MKEFENNAYFWQKVDTLYSCGDFKMTNPKGSSHAIYPSLTYPCDYGYVKTLDSDIETPLEVFKGNKDNKVKAVVLCADIINKRFEVKTLVGVDDEECEHILSFLNCTDYQKSVFIKRGSAIPAWSLSE